MEIRLEVPEEILHQLLDPVVLPRMARVRNNTPVAEPISTIADHVQQQLREMKDQQAIRPGERIAIGVGSRGIGRLDEMVRALVEEIKRLGAEPFIVPSMGSHGGATAQGQQEVLAHLGVTEEQVGAPIHSSMETVEIGRAKDGTPVKIDKLAMGADGIVFVARIKPHTAFRGTYESGLAKMIAIGLGKQEGAANCHARGFSEMANMVPALAKIALKRAPIRFALAVLENAHDQPYKILAIPADQMLAAEPDLLKEAKRAMPHIPFEQLDILVIDEIGKNISGDGADPNITGRYPTPFASGGPEVVRQVILDLAQGSDGNANGIGTADFVTMRAVQKMLLGRTYPNALTSTVPGPVKIPMILPSDRLAIAAAILTCNAIGREPRIVRIKNTLQLDRFWISEGLIKEVQQDQYLQVIEEAGPLIFDQNGNLSDPSRKKIES